MNLSDPADQSNAAIFAFGAYIAVVIFLAWLSHRFAGKGTFLSEYFLGSRNLGVWAFAFTFAATAASGGSFIGFPSLVYVHGWSVALWISSYMLVPLVAMGLLAKRLNQVSRRTEAITIPDLVLARFRSPTVGLVATAMLIFYMTFNLIAQFKGGSVILQTLLRNVPLFHQATNTVATLQKTVGISTDTIDPAYLLCLVVFGLAVIAYTTYGGFRAVVWTDVLQGVVMVVGILLLLPLTIVAVGGLDTSTRQLANSRPSRPVWVALESEAQASDATLENQTLLLVEHESQDLLLRLSEQAIVASDGRLVPVNPTAPTSPTGTPLLAAIAIDRSVDDLVIAPRAKGIRCTFLENEPYAFGSESTRSYVSLPGPSRTEASGFLPLAGACSFFFFWCFASAGQPSYMVRCMAFRDSKTLARSIMTVSIYFSLIYFPIVIIFCCAQTLLPGWESASDRIMPEMATTVTGMFGVPWLAGLLVAAPFAAVMSTMDSLLLMISSCVVRDVYQRWLRPDPSERQIKRMTYWTTLVVGLIAAAAAINPPEFLQDIIVFTGSGLATSFLVPISLALYWPRFNRQGALAGMLAGFLANIVLYALGMAVSGRLSAYEVFGLHPFVVGTVTSAAAATIVCLLTEPPKRAEIAPFFFQDKAS